ncbi:MAG: polysaccharide deacetylase family protein [Microcoleaceae cyanobacterium]
MCKGRYRLNFVLFNVALSVSLTQFPAVPVIAQFNSDFNSRDPKLEENTEEVVEYCDDAESHSKNIIRSTSSQYQAVQYPSDLDLDDEYLSEEADEAFDDDEAENELEADEELRVVTPETDPVENWVANVSQWIENPEVGLFGLVQEFGTQMVIQANISPWPTIHQKARLARVPVIMYHDILPEKEVFFDVTVEEFEAHLEQIKDSGATPISLDQLMKHLATGLPLPEKPIVLTFDDGYEGHYDIVYPLLKEYGYPAVFSIFKDKVDGKIVGRSTVTWRQLREMAADPLVTIAAHSITHPSDLTELPDVQLQLEVVESKRILEDKLGIEIRYFTYPEGNYDERVSAWVKVAGYESALTMDNDEDRFSNESKSLLAIDRFGQSELEAALEEAWGGLQLSQWKAGIDFGAPVVKHEFELEEIPLKLVFGGQPVTIHADRRYQVNEILDQTRTAEGIELVAGVDGGFFSLESLESNTMIGPVYSQSTGTFVPGNKSENRKLRNRPLVLISPDTVRFIQFKPNRHNTLEGLQAELSSVTDAFVGAGFLVRNSQPQNLESFGNLFDVNEPRHRAFWGIHQSGQPVLGVSNAQVGSVQLGQMLVQSGIRDAVMLDSGASTSLAYRGEPLMRYEPRPVPHVVALVAPIDKHKNCVVAQR